MKTNIKKAYIPLYETASKLMADLNSGGFDASLEWHFQPDEGYPLPVVTVAGYGSLTLFFDGWLYHMLMTKQKVLKCRFESLAADYSLTVYGHDDPESVICSDNDRVEDIAFNVTASKEAFINVELKGTGRVDIIAYRKLLANIERSMC